LKNGELRKLAPGIYSDSKYEPDIAIIREKYPKAVFIFNSAFYYQGLTAAFPLFIILRQIKMLQR
jgi:hypothetical protein